MGTNFCGFRHRRPSPRTSSKQDSDNKNCGLTASVMKVMKPRSLWAAMRARKRQCHRQENRDLQQLCKNINSKVLTLEDWIVSSPGFNNIINYESNLPKQSSRKIHPSFDGDHKQDFLPKCFSSEHDCHEPVQSENNTSFLPKNKKKVSFRSPVVANIFELYDSPSGDISKTMNRGFHRGTSLAELWRQV